MTQRLVAVPWACQTAGLRDAQGRIGWRTGGQKETGSGDVHGACEGDGEGNGSVVIDVGNGFADRVFIQCGLLVNQSGHQSGVTKLVDPARQALGVLEDAGHGIVGEELA